MYKKAPATQKQKNYIKFLSSQIGSAEANRIKSKILKKGRPLTRGRAHAIINHMEGVRKRAGKSAPVKEKMKPTRKVEVFKAQERPSDGQLGRVRKLEMQIGSERAEEIKEQIGIEEQPVTRWQAAEFMTLAIRERGRMWRRVWPGEEKDEKATT